MGNRNGEREITLHIPEGMDPRFAKMFFQQMLQELHELEPLAIPQAKEVVAQGLLNDSVKLAGFRKRIVEAPTGARWGITIAESQNVFMPGGVGNQTYIEAMCRMREAKNESLNMVIGTLTCFALLTSASARGLLAMHQIGMKITPPYLLEDESDEGAEG